MNLGRWNCWVELRLPGEVAAGEDYRRQRLAGKQELRIKLGLLELILMGNY